MKLLKASLLILFVMWPVMVIAIYSMNLLLIAPAIMVYAMLVTLLWLACDIREFRRSHNG